MSELFKNRGFDCLLLECGQGFEAVVLNNGNPLRVKWNSRTKWHSKRRAKDMTGQFIKHHIPIRLDDYRSLGTMPSDAVSQSRGER